MRTTRRFKRDTAKKPRRSCGGWTSVLAPARAEAERVANEYVAKRRVTKPRVTEPRVTEPRVTEPRATEPRATEPRADASAAEVPNKRVACGRCGASNEADAAFCKQCGAAIEPATDANHATA